MNRRHILTGLLAAPMIIRTPGLIMPVRRVEGGLSQYADVGFEWWPQPVRLGARFMQAQVVGGIETLDRFTGRRWVRQDWHIPAKAYLV